MDKQPYLAFDLGAGSGRAVLGTLDNGKLVTREGKLGTVVTK